MVYADANFFIGLMNSKDALYADAKDIQKKHKNDIQTSLLTIAELLVGCEKYGTDPEEVVGSIFQIAGVSGISLVEAMKAAHYMKELKITAFDAVHCALAGGQIISADKGLEKTGITRIWDR